MTYNTKRDNLVIREYGRYIQTLARWAATLESKDERNAAARQIIDLMSMMNPMFKNIEEYKHKLWDHLIIISDFKLVVDSPYPFPSRKNVVEHSDEPLPYPRHKIRMRHYGRNFESLVSKAKDIDEEKRKGLSHVAAHYMKLCYANWGREMASDDSIKQDLETISKGLLVIDKEVELQTPVVSKQNNYSQQAAGSAPRKRFDKGGFKKNRNFGKDRFPKRKKF